jgi:hydrogenase maturation protease
VTDPKQRVLLIGYGNPGRLDDGLGPALVEKLAELDLPGLELDSDYQLAVEDAAELGKYDVVVFADADVSAEPPIRVERIYPGASGAEFTSHSLGPKNVLALARDLFSAEPEAYELGIRGYEFNEFGQRLSDGALENLSAAVAYVRSAMADGEFRQVHASDGTGKASPGDASH